MANKPDSSKMQILIADSVPRRLTATRPDPAGICNLQSAICNAQFVRRDQAAC
jgi:hypothetical protein